MPRPTKNQIDAAAQLLARVWYHDGSKIDGAPGAYEELGAGIADMIMHDPPPGTLIEYLGVLDTQLVRLTTPLAEPQRLVHDLELPVRNAAS